jgi:hypothetical protein
MHSILLTDEELSLVLNALYDCGLKTGSTMDGEYPDQLNELINRLEEEEASHEQVA